MSSPSTSATAAALPPADAPNAAIARHDAGMSKSVKITYLALLVLALAAPVIGLYPVFVMKLLCFALFACAFNLLLGFTGLLSFGHAAFFGFAAYVTGYFVKVQGWADIEEAKKEIMAGVDRYQQAEDKPNY